MQSESLLFLTLGAALLLMWSPPAEAEPPTQSPFECTFRGDPADLGDRASPLDSASVRLDAGTVKVCYGAPSARGRTMIGGEHVPFGELWRIGANEATRIHVSFPAEIAGIPVDSGAYSIYAIPGESEWELFVNRSADRWGVPIDAEVRAQEVGSAALQPGSLDDHLERMVLHFEDAPGEGTLLVLEWEHTRLEIPVRPAG